MVAVTRNTIAAIVIVSIIISISIAVIGDFLFDFTQRQAKLKEAHDAAAVEIKKYKQEREDQLNGYKQQALAGQGEHEVDLKKKTEIEIQQSQVQAESRKHDVIVMLVKAVTSV
eukprot:c10689_g1_i1.p1 GENE.c10689_g1_i1~~c10689_g1_i1.p1  ORF type:complete len:114 (+),score=38.44 c10689_g1_i1:58-399(+)